jgi:predicted protein tyrosine phosphatase
MDGKNILFVCSANVNRSVTAQYWFSWLKPENNYSSRGSSKFACNKYGGTLVEETDLQQSDRIICMEKRNRKEIQNRYGSKFDSKTEVAGIKDEYQFLDLELIFELNEKIKIN